jgi:hypothetical protein
MPKVSDAVTVVAGAPAHQGLWVGCGRRSAFRHSHGVPTQWGDGPQSHALLRTWGQVCKTKSIRTQVALVRHSGWRRRRLKTRERPVAKDRKWLGLTVRKARGWQPLTNPAIAADGPLSSSVGSRTGAPTLGSGGCSSAFALALSLAAIVTFPAPASSNGAGGLPALRSPACFTSRVMGLIMLGTLSARDCGPGSC